MRIYMSINNREQQLRYIVAKGKVYEKIFRKYAQNSM